MRQRHSTARLAAAVMVSAGAMFASPGCQLRRNPPEEAVMPPPPTDPAMLHRDWQESHAIYANSSTVAGNTGFMFLPKWDEPAWLYPILDSPIFLLNVVTLPVSFIMTPPWEPVEYRSATVPPSYSAMPPLPPEPAAEATHGNDLKEPTATPSPEAAPMNSAPGEYPVPASSVPPDRPNPMAQPSSSDTLPRPDPNPPVPAAPAQQRTTSGEPVRPSTNVFTPTTHPSMPTTRPAGMNK